MVMEIVSILLGVLILLFGGLQAGGFRSLVFRLLDLPSLIIVLVFTVPVLIRNGVWKDFKRAFLLLRKNYTCHLGELRRTQDVLEMVQRQVICAGILSMLVTFVIILGSLYDLAALGPNVAVAIMTVLYATVIVMLLLPLQLEVKRRILDYMELGDEPDSAMTAEKMANAADFQEKRGMEADDVMRTGGEQDGDGKA
ncbi:MAG: hypothetical protein NC302_03485 [Bacteroidales bacterium]|nr:hypothetical protein [Bacteroidales bacterium]MCM1415014.1 hypothetical protein [bacterium]MCM1422868.1 hypothetical protein [bacterium]